MMKLTSTLSAAALTIILVFAGSSTASAAGPGVLAGLKNAAPQSSVIDVRGRHHRHRGRNVGLAILGAAAATAIIAGSARAERRRYYRVDRDRCDYLDYKCSRGYGWACRKLDRQCY